MLSTEQCVSLKTNKQKMLDGSNSGLWERLHPTLTHIIVVVVVFQAPPSLPPNRVV